MNAHACKKQFAYKEFKIDKFNQFAQKKRFQKFPNHSQFPVADLISKIQSEIVNHLF